MAASVMGYLGQFVLVQNASADAVRGSLGQFVLVQEPAAATPAASTAERRQVRILRSAGFMMESGEVQMR